MTENKRFTSWGNRIKRNGTLLNIEFKTKLDAKLCCKLLNQMDKDQKEYIDELDEIFKWHKKHYGKSILDERLEFKSDCEKENEKLKKELHKIKVVNEMLSMDFANSEHELWEENEQLKSEINMLKATIGRNEAYIERLTHKSNWDNSAFDVSEERKTNKSTVSEIYQKENDEEIPNYNFKKINYRRKRII